MTADNAYLRASILDPDAKTVDGYPKGLMATVIHPGTVTSAQATALVAHIDSLH